MDVVICLASKDYQIVKKNVRYIRQYLQKDMDTVYLLSNQTNKIFSRIDGCRNIMLCL